MRHRKYKTSARLFIPQDFLLEDTCPLLENQIHYLRNVLRLAIGAKLIVFNGKDGEWLATLTELGKKRGSITLKEQLRPYKPTSDIWAVFAPIKKTRMDFLIEKATELGASKLLPVQTEHCQIGKIKYERITAQAIEASEQCERLDIPTIEPMQSLQELLDNWDSDRTLLVCAEKGDTIPISKIINTKSTAILVGPEGGFSDNEIAILHNYPFVKMVDLGECILRAETAMITALACYQITIDKNH